MGRQKLNNNKVHCFKSLSHIHWTYLDITWRSCMCERKCLKQWVVHAMCNVQFSPWIEEIIVQRIYSECVGLPIKSIIKLNRASFGPLHFRFSFFRFSFLVLSWAVVKLFWMTCDDDEHNKYLGVQQQLNHRKYSANITHHSIVN